MADHTHHQNSQPNASAELFRNRQGCPPFNTAVLTNAAKQIQMAFKNTMNLRKKPIVASRKIPGTPTWAHALDHWPRAAVGTPLQAGQRAVAQSLKWQASPRPSGLPPRHHWRPPAVARTIHSGGACEHLLNWAHRKETPNVMIPSAGVPKRHYRGRVGHVRDVNDTKPT
jgi:hypothetical protein